MPPCSAPAPTCTRCGGRTADRVGRAGCPPCGAAGVSGVPAEQREYLPLTEEVVTAHLSGEVDLGLYPLLDGDLCRWLAADFDGEAAMLDALAYLKAARAAGAPVALEVSRSGTGAHAWLFFTAPVSAALARQVGTGLLREALALRGRMDLTSYDRLFPSQDVLQAGRPGQPDRGTAAGPVPPAGHHGVPGPGHHGAARGPVGLPVHRRPGLAGRGGSAGDTGSARSTSVPA